jgi:hypothetical protein
MRFNPRPKPKRIRLNKHKYSQLKAYVHDRDNQICVNPECQCKKDPHMPPINYVLTVFHVKHRGQGGDDTIYNTVTACMHCHELHHRGQLSNKFAIDHLNQLYGGGK